MGCLDVVTRVPFGCDRQFPSPGRSHHHRPLARPLVPTNGSSFVAVTLLKQSHNVLSISSTYLHVHLRMGRQLMIFISFFPATCHMLFAVMKTFVIRLLFISAHPT